MQCMCDLLADVADSPVTFAYMSRHRNVKFVEMCPVLRKDNVHEMTGSVVS